VSNYSVTVFLTAKTNARANGSPNPVLYIEPDGWHRSGGVVFQIPNDMPAEDRVKVVEAILRGAQQFRDAVVADVELQRTVADELAEARAEIARLKAEAEGGAA
jgi:hypothetical protein